MRAEGRMARRLLALAGLALLIGGTSVDGAGAAPQQQTLTPVTQSVLSPPRWYHGDDGRFHLSYELELTNAVEIPVTVSSLGVLRRSGGRYRDTL